MVPVKDARQLSLCSFVRVLIVIERRARQTRRANNEQRQINCQHLLHAELGDQTDLLVNAGF